MKSAFRRSTAALSERIGASSPTLAQILPLMALQRRFAATGAAPPTQSGAAGAANVAPKTPKAQSAASSSTSASSSSPAAVADPPPPPMNNRLMNQCATIVRCPVSSVAYIVAQLRSGRTVPFLARYRRDESGGLNEPQIHQIRNVAEELELVEKRRINMLKSLQQRRLLTATVVDALSRCATMQDLEDLYDPYRLKRDRIADTAREKGLEPMANTIVYTALGTPQFEQQLSRDVVSVSKTVDHPDKLFESLIKEKFMQCPGAREVADMLVRTRCSLEVKLVRKPLQDVPAEQWIQLVQHFKQYDGREYKLNAINASTLLALERGVNKGVLSLSVAFAEEDNAVIAAVIVRQFPGSARLRAPSRRNEAASPIFSMLKNALKAAVKGFVHAAIAGARRDMRLVAGKESLAHFSHNLRRQLLQRPMPVPLLVMDPGFKQGIKCAVLDEQSNPKLVFIVQLSDLDNLKASIKTVCTKHGIRRIVIGNGVGSRETEMAVADAIAAYQLDAEYAVVSETGASVYSASEIASEEFPQLNVVFRGAVFIGRRAQDPISELVKIPPKSIGVGMYQLDMPEKMLTKELQATTQSCVAFVGVNVETASKYLLQTIPGVSPKLAEAIVANRTRIKRRSDLAKVPGMTPDLYETIAGSVRVMKSPEPLDRTIIHPDWYDATRKLLARLGLTFDSRDNTSEAYQAAAKAKLAQCVRAIPPADRATMSKADLTRFAQAEAANFNKEIAAYCGVGVEAVKLIIKALMQKSLDPRMSLSESAVFRRQAVDVHSLKNGAALLGVVESVTPFGAFVDLGWGQHVLMHNKHPRYSDMRLNVGDVLENVRILVKTEVNTALLASNTSLAGFEPEEGEADTDDGNAFDNSSGGSKVSSRSGNNSNNNGASADVKRRIAVNFDQVTVQNASQVESMDSSVALENVLSLLKEERDRLLPLAAPEGWLQEKQMGKKASVEETFAM